MINKTFERRYNKVREELQRILKGGNRTMVDIKSRYEVISDLEKQKRDLIIQRDSLDEILKGKEKELKELRREIEDKEEEVEDFKSKMTEKKETIIELINSVELSLNRFTKLGEKKS